MVTRRTFVLGSVVFLPLILKRLATPDDFLFEPPLPPGVPTPIPTPVEIAPERTFTDVGNTAWFTGPHGLSGTIVVAGLQTIVIPDFCWEGEPEQLKIVMLHEDADGYLETVATLTRLRQYRYVNRILVLRVPAWIGHEDASIVAFRGARTGTTYVMAEFPPAHRCLKGEE